METEKLYYQDPYLTAFTARVLSCEKSKSGWAVVLDRTAFYPEGGGQPADHGTLGAVQVTDVHETKGVIFHTCDGPVEIGTQVAGAVDWLRRFDHMQQHSGEHILSGLLCSLYHCNNVGFHLGADTVTIDYNAELTWEQVMAAEKAANEVIWQDTPVDITFPAPDALARLNYRSKKALPARCGSWPSPGRTAAPAAAPTCAGPVRWGLSRSSPAKSFGRGCGWRFSADRGPTGISPRYTTRTAPWPSCCL